MYCIISGILLRVWVGGQEVDKVAPPVSEESFEFPWSTSFCESVDNVNIQLLQFFYFITTLLVWIFGKLQ